MPKINLEQKKNELSELNNNLATLEDSNKKRGLILDKMQKDLNKYEEIINGNENGEFLFNFLSEKVQEFNKIITEEVGVLRREVQSKIGENGKVE